MSEAGSAASGAASSVERGEGALAYALGRGGMAEMETGDGVVDGSGDAGGVAPPPGGMEVEAEGVAGVLAGVGEGSTSIPVEPTILDLMSRLNRMDNEVRILRAESAAAKESTVSRGRGRGGFPPSMRGNASAVRSAATAQALDASGVKLKLPASYSGEDEGDSFENFQFRLYEYFHNKNVVGDDPKRAVLSGVLKGAAQTAYRCIMQAVPRGVEPPTFADVWRKMEEQFSAKKETMRVRRAMRVLYQGADRVRDYVQKFRALEVRLLGVEPSELIDNFVMGLTPSVQYHMNLVQFTTVGEAQHAALNWADVRGKAGATVHVASAGGEPMEECAVDEAFYADEEMLRGKTWKVAVSNDGFCHFPVSFRSIGEYMECLEYCTLRSEWLAEACRRLGVNGLAALERKKTLGSGRAAPGPGTGEGMGSGAGTGAGTGPGPGMVADGYGGYKAKLRTDYRGYRTRQSGRGNTAGRGRARGPYQGRRQAAVHAVCPIEDYTGLQYDTKHLSDAIESQIYVRENFVKNERIAAWEEMQEGAVKGEQTIDLTGEGVREVKGDLPPGFRSVGYISPVDSNSEGAGVHMYEQFVTEQVMQLGGPPDCPTGNPRESRSLMHVQSKVGTISGISLLIDTGAGCNIIYSKTVQRLGGAVRGSRKVLRGISGADVHTLGILEVDVTIGTQSLPVQFEVLQGSGKAILGKRSLAAFHLLIDPDQDRLLHIPSSTVIPCHSVQHKHNSQCREFEHVGWRVQLEKGVLWEESPLEDDKSFPLYLPTMIRLQPNEKRMVRAGVKLALQGSLMGIFCPRSSLLLAQGIHAHVSTMPGQGMEKETQEICFVLENLGDRVARIPSQDSIGTLCIIQKNYSGTVQTTRQKN